MHDPADRQSTGRLAEPVEFQCPIGTLATIVVAVQPGSPTVQGCVTTQILTRFGKDLGTSGTPKGQTRQWQLIEAWLGGYRLERLVFVGVEHLDAGIWRRLYDLADQGPAVLLVSHAKEHSRGHRRTLAELNPKPVDAADTWPWRASDPLHQTAVPTPPPLPPVPSDPNPFFLMRAKQTLAPADYERVLEAFRIGARDASRWLEYTRKHIPCSLEMVEHLATSLPATADSHLALAVVRGAQAKLLRHRIDLQIDPMQLLGRTRRERSIRADQHIDRLCWYTDTSYPALSALALVWDYAPSELRALNLDQVTIKPGITINGRNGHNGPCAAEAAVRAHVTDVRSRSSNPDGPLFITTEGKRLTERSIQQRLRTVAVETGLPVTSRIKASIARRTAEAVARHGISLRTI
jgi:hypothetical protein